MLISTHVLSGALLGRALQRPAPALLLGVGSHLVLDHIPHWGKGGGWPPVLDEQTLRVAVADGLVGLTLIGLVLSLTPSRRRPEVLAGIVGACLSDLDKPGRLFLGRSPWPERFDRLHVRVQSESPDRLGMDITIAVVGGAATLVLLAERRQRG